MTKRIPPADVFWREDSSLSIMLAVLVMTVFIAGPLGFATKLVVINRLAFSLLLLSGLTVVANRRGILPVATLVVAVGLSIGWLGRWLAFPALAVAELIFNVLFLATMIVIVLVRSLRGGPVTVHRICGAVAAYLLCGLLFAEMFALIDHLRPGSFTASEGVYHPAGDWSGYLYLSMITLATLGYGDVTPLHPAARSLASLEAFIGQLYPAILIARLVSLEIEGRRARS
jgi:hypothetical protein